MRSKERRSGSSAKAILSNASGNGSNSAAATNASSTSSSNTNTTSCRLQHNASGISERKNSPVRKRRHGVTASSNCTAQTGGNIGSSGTTQTGVTNTSNLIPNIASAASVNSTPAVSNSQNDYSNDPYEFSDQKVDDMQQRFEISHSLRVRPESDACFNCNIETEETMTDPDVLGPCEPGMNIVLKGIVWLEAKGMLVVNVTWRNRSYMGTLLDTSEMSFPPINVKTYQPPFECRSTIRGRGKRKNVLVNRSSKSANNNTNYHIHNKRDVFVKPSLPTGNSTPDGSDDDNGTSNSKTSGRRQSPNASDDGCASVKSVSVVPTECNSTPIIDDASTLESVDADNIYQCQAKGCEHKFPTFTSLRYHMDRFHNTVTTGTTNKPQRKTSESNKKSLVNSNSHTHTGGCISSRSSRRGSPSKKRDNPIDATNGVDGLSVSLKDGDEKPLKNCHITGSPAHQREDSHSMGSSCMESLTTTSESKPEQCDPSPQSLIESLSKSSTPLATAIPSCTAGINGLRIGPSSSISQSTRTVNSHLVNIPTLLDATTQPLPPSAQQQVSASISVKPFIRFPFANIPSQSSPSGSGGTVVSCVNTVNPTAVTASLPSIPGTNLFSKTSATTPVPGADLLVSQQQSQSVTQTNTLKPIQPRSGNVSNATAVLFAPRQSTESNGSMIMDTGKPVSGSSCFPLPPPGCNSPQLELINRKRTISPLVANSIPQDSISNCMLSSKPKRPCNTASPLPSYDPVVNMSQQSTAINHLGGGSCSSSAHLLEEGVNNRSIKEEFVSTGLLSQNAVPNTNRSQTQNPVLVGGIVSGPTSAKTKVSPTKSDGTSSIPFLTDAVPSPAYSDISEVNDDCPAPILEIEEEHKSPTTGGMNPPALVPAVSDDCTPIISESVSSSSSLYDSSVGLSSGHHLRKQSTSGNKAQHPEPLLPMNSNSNVLCESMNSCNSLISKTFTLQENLCNASVLPPTAVTNVMNYKSYVTASPLHSNSTSGILGSGNVMTSGTSSNSLLHPVNDNGTNNHNQTVSRNISLTGSGALSGSTAVPGTGFASTNSVISSVSNSLTSCLNPANNHSQLPSHHHHHHHQPSTLLSGHSNSKVFAATHSNTAASLLQNFSGTCAGDSANYIMINNNAINHTNLVANNLLLQNSAPGSYVQQKD